ncbi:DNA cross-link repair protein PSO2/SNM1 [Ophidiomyces ophidiicola]|nr:DNA cross-link repair protein PSO2/SNM1 [Ophidiomyces ophidiicola]
MGPSSTPAARTTKPSLGRPSRFGPPKSSTGRNASLLQFFSKSDGPPKLKSSQSRITSYTIKGRSGNGSQDKSCMNTNARDLEGLFVEDVGMGGNTAAILEHRLPDSRDRSQSPDYLWADIGNPNFTAQGYNNDRYHENGTSIKRRKIEDDGMGVNSLPLEARESVMTINETAGDTKEGRSSSKDNTATAKKPSYSGPFVIDSDSESELELSRDPLEPLNIDIPHIPKETDAIESRPTDFVFEAQSEVGIGDGGKEVDSSDSEEGDPDESTECDVFGNIGGYVDEEAAVCPVCQSSLEGLTEHESSLHVNQCLDGASTKPEGIKPQEVDKPATTAELKVMARPGQKNPFKISSNTTTTLSAFTKIMSGNAEDAAWSAAAANEVASRGKQSYERICPFYKILPGFSITVDAFRYGAIEGCNAYFLSHFHSDHYVGLNSNWSHGQIYCSKVTGNLVRQQLKVKAKYVVDLEFEAPIEVPETAGVKVTMIPANHCPGSSIFLFEKRYNNSQKIQRILHCGDFRASPAHILHPLLKPNIVDERTGRSREQRIDACYLDTTYLNPKFGFPVQEDVIDSCAQMCVNLDKNKPDGDDIWKVGGDALAKDSTADHSHKAKRRLLVVIGTYSIGKERICLGIAKALNCKIYATAEKQRICACLEDPELSRMLTNDPLEAQVHMHSLMDIRADTLSDYLHSLKPHFTHIVGFRPTGWNYRSPAGRMTDSPPVSAVLRSDSWKARFTTKSLVPQRGSTKEISCFGVPYSEHSSFRELTMFCCALRIGKVIPTVNVASRRTREKMKAWIHKYEAEKRKSGLFSVDENATRW